MKTIPAVLVLLCLLAAALCVLADPNNDQEGFHPSENSTATATGLAVSALTAVAMAILA